MAENDAKTEESVPIHVFDAFVETVSSISHQTDASEVALIIIEQACRVLQCERTSFFFVDGDHLDLVIGRGLASMRLPITSGIAGACATSGEILNIPDPYADARFSQEWDKKNNFRTRSILAAPVVDPEGETLGVLQGINKLGGPFTAVDEQLMHCLAGQVGVSIRYTYQLDEAERATRQRNALVACIQDISSNSNVQHLLFTMNKAVLNLVEADRCSFYTVNRVAETLSLIKSDAASDISFPMTRGLAGFVATTGNTLNIEDAYEDSRFNQAYDRQTGFRTRSMLVLPVFAEYNEVLGDEDSVKRPIGVLQVINKAHEEVFTQEDVDVLEVLLRFVGPAIAGSPLFGSKSNEPTEGDRIRDINPKLSRKPSRELVLSTPRAIPSSIDEAGEENSFTYDEESERDAATSPSYT